MRSRIEPMQEMARPLRRHRPILLNWFRARGEISNGSVEGMNIKAKLAIRKAYGFKSHEMIDTKMKTAHRRDKHAGGHRSTFGASETKRLLSKWHLCRACVQFTWPAQLYADSRPIQTSEHRNNSLKNLMLISAYPSDG
jgi:hypothetical protein